MSRVDFAPDAVLWGTLSPAGRADWLPITAHRRCAYLPGSVGWASQSAWRHVVKTVVIGESSGASREAIMAVYPRHKMVVDRFVARGVVLGIGPFTDGGNMAIFKTRAEAEAFSREDPFILEGLVKSFVIKDWGDLLLPE